MSLQRWGACFTWLGMAALLAGCAATPRPITNEGQLSGDEGAVVFKLVTNGTFLFNPGDLVSVTLERVPVAGQTTLLTDKAILSRTRTTTHSTAVFSGMVAPGRYRLLEGNGASHIFPLRGLPEPFDVKTGEVTLLGTLVVQALEHPRFVVGYVPPDAEQARSLESLFPALARQTQGKPFSTFEPSPNIVERERIATRVRELGSAYNGVHARPDGSVLAGSKMGRVLWRKAGDDRWRVLVLDTWSEILSVRMYRDGLLAAGEEGLLLHSGDEGRTWKTLPPPDLGVIAAVAPLNNGKVIALVRRDTQWTAYSSQNLTTGAWRKIGSFEQQRSLNVPWQNGIPLVTGNRAGILMPTGDFFVVNGDTETIERASTGLSTYDAHVTPDGLLVVKGAIVVASTVVSADGGANWRNLDVSRFTHALTFADASTAYAISPVDPGVSPITYDLKVSRDGAKTWSTVGKVPGGEPNAASALIYDRNDRALFALMRNGQVLRSSDEGRTWSRAL